MVISTLFFGLLTGSFFAVLVGVLGSRRRIGFGWPFLISLILTPIVGLIVVLLSDPLPPSCKKRWGCIGSLLAIVGLLLGLLMLAMLIYALVQGWEWMNFS